MSAKKHFLKWTNLISQKKIVKIVFYLKDNQAKNIENAIKTIKAITRKIIISLRGNFISFKPLFPFEAY